MEVKRFLTEIEDLFLAPRTSLLSDLKRIYKVLLREIQRIDPHKRLSTLPEKNGGQVLAAAIVALGGAYGVGRIVERGLVLPINQKDAHILVDLWGRALSSELLIKEIAASLPAESDKAQWSLPTDIQVALSSAQQCLLEASKELAKRQAVSSYSRSLDWIFSLIRDQLTAIPFRAWLAAQS